MSGLHIANGWNGGIDVAADSDRLALTVRCGHESDGRAVVTVRLDDAQVGELIAALTHMRGAMAQRVPTIAELAMPRATEMGAPV